MTHASAHDQVRQSDGVHVAGPIELDRASANLMITGTIVSTERAAAVGDRGWRGLLASNHALIRNRRARLRGREIETAGDGFLAMLRRTPGAWHLYATASS